MADESISFALEITGEDKVSRALGNVAGSTGQVDVATRRLSGAVADAGAKWNTFGSTLGLVGRGIATQNQTLGQLVGTLGSAVGSIGTLSAAMGPLGIVIGVASTAFTLYQQATAGARRETDNLKTATDQLIPSLETLVSKIEAAEAARGRMSNIMQGRGSGAERQAVQIREAERLAADIAAIRGSGPETDEIRRRVAAREAVGRTASEFLSEVTAPAGGYVFSEEEAIAGERRLGVRDPERRRRGGGAGRARDAEAERRRLSAEMAYGNRNPNARGGQQLGTYDPEAENRREAEKEATSLRERFEAERAIAAERSELLEGEREKEQRAHEERLSELDEWGAAGERVGAALYDAFELVASGQATLAQAAAQLFKQSLQQFAKSEMLEAGKEIGLAIGSLAMENYPGAAKHFASAAQHGLVAAAAGVGAAAIGGASAGGGGGRSNARPESAGRGAGGGGGPSTIVVNLPATTILAGTYADAGRMVSRVLRAEMRTYA